MADGVHYAIVKEWDEQLFLSQGSFHFLRDGDIESLKQTGVRYHKVAYAGMGCMLMKKGVLESLQYPFFTSTLIKLNENIQDICSEDSSLARRLAAVGVHVYLDLDVCVKHLKLVAL
jgi:DhnA family fructose-bisphosphate aldolase class Ia